MLSAVQSDSTRASAPVHLQVDAGTPLRLYITHRVWFKKNETVEAKFAEAVWAFDRVVIPAGTVIHGKVSTLEPVPSMERARAVVGGDFTPLKRAEVSFDALTFPDGRIMQLETQDSLGLPTIYVPSSPKPKKIQGNKRSTPKPNSAKPPGRVNQFIRQQAQTQLSGQLNMRSRGFFDLIRGPNKRERLENFLMTKLPYHPQWYPSGTRFDAVLKQPIDFGEVNSPRQELQAIGTQPARDSVVQMRILTTISSQDARAGDSIEGVLSEPLFSPEQKLVLPQGTHLHGKITLARRARLLHRAGQLRFAIDNVELPSALAALRNPELDESKSASQPVQAQLVAAEADPNAVKIDPEGTAKATESKTRLLRPAIAGLVAAKSLDEDSGRQTASGTGSPNPSGRALGGFSGFGLLGIAMAQGPHQLAAGLGFYGLAWSVYTNIIGRGFDVTFQKNTAMAIRFGAPPRKR